MRARKNRRRSPFGRIAVTLMLIAAPIALTVVPFGIFAASITLAGIRTPSWLGAAAAVLSFVAFVIMVRIGSGCIAMGTAELLLIPAFITPILWIGNTIVQWIVLGAIALVGYPVVAAINARFLDYSEPPDDLEAEREASMRIRPGEAMGNDPQDEDRGFGGFL